jgi:hypothetical protein
MRKINGWIFTFFLFSISMAVAKPTHLEKLRSLYPYGLIGGDYGLLTVEDLAVNTCNAEKLTPFVSEENGAYPYWRCFPLKSTKMECESIGYDPTVKMEKSYMSIEARGENEFEFYLARDARDMRDCKEYLRDWKRETQGEKYVCIAGSFGRVMVAKDGAKETDWVFEKYKTRKGCVSDGFACSLSGVSDCAHHVSSR